jgi:hypothetical protein
VILTRALDAGTNVPIAVLSLDLATCTTFALAETFGSGIGSAALSPSGKYLAFRVGRHASACEASSAPIVLNLEARRLRDLPTLTRGQDAARGPSNVEALRFRDVTHLGVDVVTLVHPIGEHPSPADRDEHEPRLRTSATFDLTSWQW